MCKKSETTDRQPDDRYWRVAEIAARWRVSAKTVYRIIGNGGLPVFEVGGQLRIGQKDLEAFERKNRRILRKKQVRHTNPTGTEVLSGQAIGKTVAQ